MSKVLGVPQEPVQDINVLPLIDVLLVLIIVFFLMLRGLTFIPAQLPPPPEDTLGGSAPEAIVLELRQDGSYAINGQPIPASHLDTQLRAIYEGRPAKVLFIVAAPNRVYQEVVTAMDIARGAGVEVLGLVPREERSGRP